MPELPEAEANRKRVAAGALHRTIEGFDLHDTTHLELPGDNARQRLVGHQLTETRRHGKLIFAGSKSGPWIGVHLGMTGSLHSFDEGRELRDVARIVIRFEGARRLVFYNARKFGWLRVIDDVDAFLEDQEVGPDAMEIDAETFRARMGRSRGAVKSALIDQKKQAGIGNIWSDETLYRAGVAPQAAPRDLSEDTLDHVFKAQREIIGAVLDTEADYSRLPDDWLIRNREEGAACPRCDGTILKSRVGGRSAFYCGTHQGAGP